MNPIRDSSFRKLPRFFREKLAEAPDKVIYTFVNDKGEEAAHLTRARLDERARKIAYHLLYECHLKKGDTALLVYPPGLDFIEALLGCFYAGIIPVPVPPPMPLKPELGLAGYTHIAENCEAKIQLTSAAYSLGRTFGRIRLALKNTKKWPDLRWVVTDRIFGPNLPVEEIADSEKEEVALIQYTSGSTRLPKGVLVTHENLWVQCQLIQNHLWVGTGVTVLWMPHYHDFTLMGGIVDCLYGDLRVVLFSPLGFLKRPSLWGELLHRYEANTTASPDFGYEFLATRTTPEERSRWDLRPLRVAICAAEPIRASTVDKFLNAFAGSGIRPEVFCPCYGLAEHTIGATVHGKKRFFFYRKDLETPGSVLTPIPRSEVSEGLPSEQIAELIGCGPAAEGVELRLVDPSCGVETDPGQAGEIWLRSRNVAKGYFNNPEETAKRFGATLADSPDTWLRTGDLGVWAEDELVVLGRLDDVIILRGKNYYPQDIEEIVFESDERVRKGRVIAFADDREGQRELVILVELKEDSADEKAYAEVSAAARVLLMQELGLAGFTIAFVERGSVQKTTSGKLQRKKSRAEWTAGRLTVRQVHR